MEDYYRREQLLGQLDSTISFTSRPFDIASLPPSVNASLPPVSLRACEAIRSTNARLSLLPFTMQNQWNSHHPYSINDGPMIPARGYQTLLTGGFFAKLGPLSIQLKPELVLAENRPFETFLSGNKTTAQIAAFNAFNSVIDFPESFPGRPYTKAFWGQSSVRLTFGPVSAGISTENLWWGPGMRNALLMTNSAAGFNHFTINTIKPVKTPIGSLEGQIVGGKLESSGTAYSENKRNDWRYFNGIVLSYQPRWVPGLFLGGTRSFQIYHQDVSGGFFGYFPIFEPNTKTNLYGSSGDVKPDDQRISVFARWVLPKDHFEAYFEFGHEDGNYNMRDFLVQADHTRAYILGIRKLFMLNKHDQKYLSFLFEMTQLEQNMIDKNRASAYFYSHGAIAQGYTHQGQLLGAGIGPGSNLQTATVSWCKGMKSLGVQLERFVHNNDLFYNFSGDIRAHWVDLNLALTGEWDWKKFFFTAKIETIRSLNYEYNYTPIANNPSNYWVPGKDIYNFQVNLGTTYRF